MSNRDRKNGVPATATSIPLVDPRAMPDNPSIGELVRDATTQVSTLVRAEVELARAEITRDVKKGLSGSAFFIAALVVLLYSTFFMFLFLAELLDTWLWRWAAFLTVFILMLVVTAVFAFLGYRKVRRIRGPQQTIESVKETTAALTPALAKFTGTPSPAASRPATTAAAVAATASVAATYPAPAEYVEYVEYAEQTEYAEYEYVEPAEYTEYEYAEPTEHTEYAEQQEVYTQYEYSQPAEHTEYEYAESIGYPTAHDPTAAVYADTGLPVTTDDDPLRRDPSGW